MLKDKTYLLVYMFWMKLILVELFPFICLSVLNTSLILITKRSSRAQPRSHQASKKEESMNRILVIIVLLYVICQSFKLVPDFYEVYACYGSKE